MDNMLKDLAVLLFSAGEEIEKKAREFKEQRETRHRTFEEKIQEHKEACKSKYSEELCGVKENISELTSKLGLASKAEIDELKEMIADLANKVDNLGK